MIIKKNVGRVSMPVFQYVDHSGGTQNPDDLHRYIRTNFNTELKTKRFPVLFDKKEKCCGCSACYAICPMSREKRSVDSKYSGGKIMLTVSVKVGKMQIEMQTEYTGAITMMPDEQGFLYPTVDVSMCIGCLKCESVCVFK